MKRIFSMILALALVIACLPVFPLEVHAVTTVASGTCGADGSNVTWTLDDTGTLTISGSGAMADFSNYSAVPWDSFTRLISKVVINKGVISIGDRAFYACYYLNDIKIPNSVTSIGEFSFTSCSNLTSLELPNSITHIGGQAFWGCNSLLSIKIPDSVISIDSWAFLECRKLTSVEIGDSVEIIGNAAFADCPCLTSVKLGSSLTTIVGLAFQNCDSLTNIEIPDSVTSIGDGAFSSCDSLIGITVDDNNHHFSNDDGVLFNKNKSVLLCYPGGKQGSYVIPESVTHIGALAFQGCANLSSVEIPNSVTSIGAQAFRGCTGLSKIEIPDTVTSIGNYAFDLCVGLNEITFKGKNPTFGDNAFHSVTATAYYPADDATWTEDVRQNYGGTITWVPYGDDSSDPNSGKCGDNVYWKYEDATLTISGTGAMYDYTTAEEPKPWDGLDITYVVIEDGVTHVGAYAFCGIEVTYVTIGDTVTSIGERAFAYCNGLWQVTIGNSVETIGDGAFAMCYSICDIVIPDSVKVIGTDAFAENISLANITIGKSVSTIGIRAFANCRFSEIVIPASVTSIGNSAFADNGNMQKITFEGDAPSFGTDVFGGLSYPAEAEAYYPGNNTTWTASKRQQYGGKITWIPYGSEEFDNIMATGTCGTNLTWTLTKDGVLTISGTGKMYDYSFDSSPWYNYRNSVKTVVIEDEVTSIGDCAFDSCKNLSSLTMGDGVTSIGVWAFYLCGSLSEVVIGDRVTSIGGYAFSGCGVSKVTMGASVASIGSGVVSGNFGEIIFTGNAPSFASTAFDFAVGTIYYPADNPTWTADIMQDYGNGPITWIPYQTGPAIVASGKCGANLTWKLTEDGVLTISGTGDMDNYTDDTMPWYDYKNSVKSVVIENGVTSIGDCAFKDFGSLTDVAIGETVTGIGDYAFDCCDLASLTIPNSVTSIGIYAFRHCKRLTSLNFPNSVTSIGAYAFCYCTGLTEVTFGKSVTFIDDGAFYECTNLNKITFKGSAPTIGSSIMAGLTFSGVRATAYYYPDETWTEDVMQVCGSLITWVAMEMPKLSLGGEEFADQDTVWIEGLPYPIQGEGNDRYVELPTEDDCYMVTYTYHTGDANDVHTQYPTGMKVYKVSDGQITHIPQLDNLLQYSGASIRITGKKGIRMITSLTKTNKTALTGKGLAGFKLLEYGTALCFAHEIPQGDALVLGRDFTRSNYAYKKGVADPVFASTKDLIQYTNVLVGFSLDQCKDDIAMRPYIILEDAAGNQITLYGGTIYRSIGYIAYQNRTVFTPKTASYNYVWEIIHHVYGDKYDADFKG